MGRKTLMPRFHQSVAVLPLPFFRSIATAAVAGERMKSLETSFRIHRDEVTRTLIGCPQAAERQKIGFDPIATERQLRRNGRWKRQRCNRIFHVRNVILMALT